MAKYQFETMNFEVGNWQANAVHNIDLFHCAGENTRISSNPLHFIYHLELTSIEFSMPTMMVSMRACKMIQTV